MRKRRKTKIEAIRYHGWLQGYKVYIDGIKYPRQRGHWYATLDAEEAYDRASHDMQMVALSTSRSPY